MSTASIKIALEKALKASIPPLDPETGLSGFPIAFENVNYTPPANGDAYASVWLLPGEPENPTFGDDFRREIGYIQVTLNYPINGGAGRAYNTAEGIRDAFPRGSSFTACDVTVHIARTPAIGPGSIADDRYLLPVRIRYFANIMP